MSLHFSNATMLEIICRGSILYHSKLKARWIMISSFVKRLTCAVLLYINMQVESNSRLAQIFSI